MAAQALGVGLGVRLRLRLRLHQLPQRLVQLLTLLLLGVGWLLCVALPVVYVSEVCAIANGLVFRN